jgi:hypothetical protein
VSAHVVGPERARLDFTGKAFFMLSTQMNSRSSMIFAPPWRGMQRNSTIGSTVRSKVFASPSFRAGFEARPYLADCDDYQILGK